MTQLATTISILGIKGSVAIKWISSLSDHQHHGSSSDSLHGCSCLLLLSQWRQEGRREGQLSKQHQRLCSQLQCPLSRTIQGSVSFLFYSHVHTAFIAGGCGNDGFYFNDYDSFVICSNGNAYVQPCAPGSKNSALDTYHYGNSYYYRDFCDVNLVDDGYTLRHAPYHGADRAASLDGYNTGYGSYGYNDGYQHGYAGPTGYGAKPHAGSYQRTEYEHHETHNKPYWWRGQLCWINQFWKHNISPHSFNSIFYNWLYVSQSCTQIHTNDNESITHTLVS